VRFRVLRFLSIIGKIGEVDDIKDLLKKGILDSVFTFLEYQGGPLRKNDIRACLKVFIYLIKRSEALNASELDIRHNEEFMKKVTEEIHKLNPDDIGEIGELKVILKMK
jgi:hypothetical protein